MLSNHLMTPPFFTSDQFHLIRFPRQNNSKLIAVRRFIIISISVCDLSIGTRVYAEVFLSALGISYCPIGSLVHYISVSMAYIRR